MLLLLVLGACQRDVDGIAFEPEVAIPLFSASSTLADLFGEDTDSTELIISPDGGMTLVYRGNLVRREASEIFQAIPAFPGIMTDTVLTAPFTLENQIRIIRARFTSGNIFVQLNSDIPEDLDFVLEFPDVKKNGETLKVAGEIKYNGSLPVTAVFPVNPTAGYDIELGGLEVNVRYFATRKSNGERVKLPTVGFLITGIKFSYLEGYFGYEQHKIDRDTIVMDIFRDIIQGGLAFADPRVTIYVDNAFGFPLRSKVEVLRVSNETAFADLESPQIASGFDFLYPALSEAGQSRRTNFYFDRNNSNIKDVFNLNPLYLDYQIDAVSNPDEIVDLIGFTTDSSFFALGVQVELPLYGKANGFTAEKTYEVDFSGLKDLKQAELKLVTENAMPVEIAAQLTLLDGQGQVLGVLLPDFDLILQAAPVDGNGFSKGVARKETFIPVDEALMVQLIRAKAIRIDSRFSTSGMGQEDVQIRSTDEVRMRMGIRATLNARLGGQ